MKPDTLKPFAFAAVAVGTTLWLTGSHWIWAVAGVAVFIAMAAIEVWYENNIEYLNTSINRRYRILTQGTEIVPVDYRLVHLHRQAHPHDEKYWTVTMTFEGREREYL